MFYSFLFQKKSIIFLLSMIIGFVSYLVTASIILIRKPALSPAQAAVGRVTLEPSRFEGEFTLFAVTKRPVDLGHDANGSIYFLGRSGELVKSDQESGKGRLSTIFKIKTDHFLEKKGCISIAFHPDFLNQHQRGFGKFYVSLSEAKATGKTIEAVDSEQYQEVIYEYSCIDPLAKTFSARKREVLRLSKLSSIKGPSITDLTFDQRGLLYIGIADAKESEKSKASDLESVYGKVLRIDPLPDSVKNTAYRVPESNPFFTVMGCLPELWSYGLRNPHTVSYDPFLEWVCISDTGQEMLEEINVSDLGAEFFGWNLAEGSFFYPPSAAHALNEEIISQPQIEYARSRTVGRNVGGLIYRGERFPYLDGKAIFADESGRLLTAAVTPHKATHKLNLLQPVGAMTEKIECLKEGPRGELFVFCKNGKIFELQKARPIQQRYRSLVMMASLGY